MGSEAVSPAAASRAAIGAALATPLLMIGSCGISPVVLSLVAGLLAYACWRSGMKRQLLKTSGISVGRARRTSARAVSFRLRTTAALPFRGVDAGSQARAGERYRPVRTGSLAPSRHCRRWAHEFRAEGPCSRWRPTVHCVRGWRPHPRCCAGGPAVGTPSGLSTGPIPFSNRSALGVRSVAAPPPILTMLLLLERPMGLARPRLGRLPARRSSAPRANRRSWAPSWLS